MKTVLILLLASVLVTPKPVSTTPVKENGKAVEFTVPQEILVNADAAFAPLVSTWNAFTHRDGNTAFPAIFNVEDRNYANVVIEEDKALEEEEYTLEMGASKSLLK